jgi:ribonuclease HII
LKRPTKLKPSFDIERRLRAAGHHNIAGIDEVGRGPAAGPLVVAAVVLPSDFQVEGVQDSKLLSPKRRVELAQEIKKQAAAIGIGWVEHEYIDANGLTQSLREASRLAIQQIRIDINAIILDGSQNYLITEVHTEVMPKADQISLSVACASIVAKVARDYYMELMHNRYPSYGFDRHKGYLSSAHLAALQQYGPSPIHRLSWGRVGGKPISN